MPTDTEHTQAGCGGSFEDAAQSQALEHAFETWLLQWPWPQLGHLRRGIGIAVAHFHTKEPDDAVSRPRDQQVPVVIESCAVDGNGLWVQ